MNFRPAARVGAAERNSGFNFLVVGGGYTGIELAAELAYRSGRGAHGPRIGLLEAGPRLLPGGDGWLAREAAAGLERLGVGSSLGRRRCPLTRVASRSRAVRLGRGRWSGRRAYGRHACWPNRGCRSAATVEHSSIVPWRRSATPKCWSWVMRQRRPIGPGTAAVIGADRGSRGRLRG